jgi:hypothetical protein
MMSGRVTSGWLLTLVAAWLCLPLSAALAQADSEEYARLLRDGVQEFGLGNFGEARLLFSRAHEITPTARTYRGLGLCDYELRHYVNAIEELQAAMSDPRRPLTPDLRTQVEPLLERARQYVGRYRLRVPPGVSNVKVDGKVRPLPAPGAELLLDPGPHSLEIRPSTGPAIERELNVEVGAREELALLPVAPAPQPVAAPREEQPVQLFAPPLAATEPTAPAAASPRVFTWVAVGLTGAFGAGILGFGLGAKAKNNAYKDQIDMGLVPDPELKSSGQTFETLTNISIVGCALSAAAAVTLFFVEGGKREPQLQAGVVPGGAFVSGRF